MGERDLIILARSKLVAERIATARGIDLPRMLWPRDIDDLRGYEGTPIWVDKTLWGHPHALDLAEFVATTIRAIERSHRRKPELVTQSVHD